MLERHEGCRCEPYADPTNKTTIGIGYNVADRGWAALEGVIGRTLWMDPNSIEVRVTDGVRHHQIYPTSKQVLQIFIETKVGSEGVLRSRYEPDERVDIAAFLVEALGGS